MRVIAGTAKRIQLKTLEGLDTRPTTDRLKETLFNMLQYGLADCCFLDLFGGSGGIGIEALSRGAAFCIFVEQNPAAAACIRENLNKTKLEEKALVMNYDALTALKRLEGKQYRFDYIFMDPPYGEGLERQMLEYLAQSRLIGEDSTVIIEASLETSFDYLESIGFTMEKNKEYKTNKHVFVMRRIDYGNSSVSRQL